MSTRHDGGKHPRENGGERQEKLGRRPGSAAGRIVVRDDFDDPLPEEMLAAYVVGREAEIEQDRDGDEGEV